MKNRTASKLWKIKEIRTQIDLTPYEDYGSYFSNDGKGNFCVDEEKIFVSDCGNYTSVLDSKTHRFNTEKEAKSFIDAFMKSNKN